MWCGRGGGPDITSEPFASSSDPPVRGFLHPPAHEHPAHEPGDGLVLTHGAGSNCQSWLLAALAEQFAAAGFTVLRCDLPFRQSRPFGPPRPGDAARDREGLAQAVAALRPLVPGRLFLGGHSYGGRQATMLAAEREAAADGLLLLSYPLHPPRKPEQLRTHHFPQISKPALFVHGTRDPFGSIAEMELALGLIPAKKTLVPVEDAGHDLKFKSQAKTQPVPAQALQAFQQFFGSHARKA